MKKFVIPSAADFQKSENAKPKVKSYFKSKKDAEKTESKIPSSSNENKGNSAVKSAGSQERSNVEVRVVCENQAVIRATPDIQPVGNVASSRPLSTEQEKISAPCILSLPSTSSVNDPIKRSNEITSMSTSKKIGSGFAEKFGALKETAAYEAPKVVDKPAVNTDEAPLVTTKPVSSYCLIVHPKQRGNPILKHVRNVPYEFKDIVPDYIMGKTSCALFLSLRYHLLNPNYIYGRLKGLANMFHLRLLLVQVDIRDPGHALKALAKMAILSDCTLLLAWSAEEAGRYLETYKSYENKSADTLKERVEADFMSKITDCLTTIKSVNKTDVSTLLSTFESFNGIVNATEDELAFCPGFGPHKAKRAARALREPFLKKKRTKLNIENKGNPGDVKPEGRNSEDIPGTSGT